MLSATNDDRIIVIIEAITGMSGQSLVITAGGIAEDKKAMDGEAAVPPDITHVLR